MKRRFAHKRNIILATLVFLLLLLLYLEPGEIMDAKVTQKHNNINNTYTLSISDAPETIGMGSSLDCIVEGYYKTSKNKVRYEFVGSITIGEINFDFTETRPLVTSLVSINDKTWYFGAVTEEDINSDFNFQIYHKEFYLVDKLMVSNNANDYIEIELTLNE